MSKCALTDACVSSRVPFVEIRTHAHKSEFKCHVEVCMHVCNEPKLVQNHLPRWFQWNRFNSD